MTGARFFRLLSRIPLLRRARFIHRRCHWAAGVTLAQTLPLMREYNERMSSLLDENKNAPSPFLVALEKRKR